MEVSLPCTICGVSAARLCTTCHSAAYCSIECQQTDWRTHKLLCREFKDISASNFAARPSPQHRLAIYFPMVTSSPSVVWVDTEEDGHQKGYFNPKLEHLLVVPGYNEYIDRNLLCVRGNSLRGRKTNQDTLNIWCLDPRSRFCSQPHCQQVDSWYNSKFDWRRVGRILLGGPSRRGLEGRKCGGPSPSYRYHLDCIPGCD